jgi:hypothetical protein
VTIVSAQQTFPSSLGHNDRRSIVELIRLGATWEDDLSPFQALRHFYDPVNDRALDLPSVGTTLSIPSPDWALEDRQEYPGPEIAEQRFSYKDARSYLFQALTDPSEAQRRKYFGLMFQSLGHVMHHLQDMAQPQHVRNDPHCDRDTCWVVAKLTGAPLLYAPSLYERYTNLDKADDPINQIRRNLPYEGVGSTPVYPGAGATAGAFRTPRQFWRTTPQGSDTSTGKGIAEYTNRNFFSAGTIYRYDSPRVREITQPDEVADIRQLLPGTTLSGTISFYRSVVTDSLAGGEPIENPRAAAHSIFSPELRQQISSTEVHRMYLGLNRFTFDAAHRFLIPRAVAYSAGLINYFFRGELEIGPGDDGIYGAVDHTLEKDANVHGFRSIRLKVRNVTPGGSGPDDEPVVENIPANSGGALLAVVRFHRNDCYRPDLSGEFGSPGIDWRTCRSPVESLVVSDTLPVPHGINREAVPMTFAFPDPVPINATDVRLQIVYRGPLGDEQDSVAVATRDISEPTYIYQYSTWDQFLYQQFPFVSAGSNTFQQWCAQGFEKYDDCRRAMGLTWKLRFAATPGYTDTPAVSEGTWRPLSAKPPFDPALTLPAPVGTYARVAVLADLDPVPIVLVQEGVNILNGTVVFQWGQGTFIVNRNQLDQASGEMISTSTYVSGRGIFVHAADGFLLNAGTAPSIPPLVPEPSEIHLQ